jgi:hypothetical protein
LEKKKLSHLLFLILLLFFLIAGYWEAFDQTNRFKVLDTFDNIMSEDTAQIARNTIGGNPFITKYILPVGYAYFPQIENHPDFIRYPFIIILYSALFIVAPSTSATIKIFNGILFVINGLFLFRISLEILERNNPFQLPRLLRNITAWLTAIFLSFMLKDYLSYSLSDAYEIPTISVLLLLITAFYIWKSPIWSGVFQGILYLCRPNMIVFAPFVFLYIYSVGPISFKRLLKTSIEFGGMFLLILSPFIARSMLLSGHVLFSLQQSIELIQGTTVDHRSLYNQFAIPNSIFPLTHDFLKKLLLKFLTEGIKPIQFALKFEYVLGFIGSAFFILFYRKERKFFFLFIAATILHIIVFSFYLQLDRIYVPIFFILAFFGFLGLFTALMGVFWTTQNRQIVMSPILMMILIITFSRLTLLETGFQKPERDNRTRPPSNEAVDALKNNAIQCVYSNDPYWIPWYADIVAIYSPNDLDEIYTKGPKECRFFIVDERKPYPKTYLEENASEIEIGENYKLYSLFEDGNDNL